MGNLITPLLFQPPRPRTYNDGRSYFYLETSLGEKIAATFIDHDAEITLLFSHSNAEDLGLIRFYLNELANVLRVNVLAYDYTGYGLNASESSEAHCYADIQAAFDFLTKDRRIAPERIILYGRSIGTGVACHLAWQEGEAGRKLGGVILQSPLMSAYRIGAHFRFTLWGDQFCSIDKVGGIKAPVFIIHGERDEVVPFHHGQELYLATHPLWRFQPLWVPEAGHNNIEYLLYDTNEFFAALKKFITFVGQSSTTQNGS